MVGIGKYAGIRFKNLSMTPLNDIKLMSTTLRKADYCLENSYENIKSKRQFEDIIDTYVESVNRSPEEVGNESLLIISYSIDQPLYFRNVTIYFKPGHFRV